MISWHHRRVLIPGTMLVKANQYVYELMDDDGRSEGRQRKSPHGFCALGEVMVYIRNFSSSRREFWKAGLTLIIAAQLAQRGCRCRYSLAGMMGLFHIFDARPKQSCWKYTTVSGETELDA